MAAPSRRDWRRPARYCLGDLPHRDAAGGWHRDVARVAAADRASGIHVDGPIAVVVALAACAWHVRAIQGDLDSFQGALARMRAMDQR